MNCILFDDVTWTNLLPLTFTRPVCESRVGILKISEKWQKRFSEHISYLTKDYLSVKYPASFSEENYLINGSVLPDDELVKRINSLKHGQVLTCGQVVVAALLDAEQSSKFNPADIDHYEKIDAPFSFCKIDYPWDIFTYNEQAINQDLELLIKGRKSSPISSTNQVLFPERIFIEEGATVEFSILNAQNGPIYIGKEAEIMEGCMVRGPLALCDHAVLKMGAKVYGATTIGPYCKVGGEINNSVLFAYSNKAHDGFLGNAVLGEWCNLGADTNNSNLKNNYVQVKVWNYGKERFIDSGLQFCGLIMGDHSKTAIGTMFNTGTVVGVNANIFGAGFPRNFVPSFSLGGPGGFTTFGISKAFEVAREVMSRRHLQLSDADEQILKNVFELTKKYRRF
jgi:UDP-N-acetylglucosamine diphosphorylase/glucosamine-1-phosphate N-acetyltransferase